MIVRASENAEDKVTVTSVFCLSLRLIETRGQRTSGQPRAHPLLVVQSVVELSWPQNAHCSHQGAPAHHLLGVFAQLRGLQIESRYSLRCGRAVLRGREELFSSFTTLSCMCPGQEWPQSCRAYPNRLQVYKTPGCAPSRCARDPRASTELLPGGGGGAVAAETQPLCVMCCTREVVCLSLSVLHWTPSPAQALHSQSHRLL